MTLTLDFTYDETDNFLEYVLDLCIKVMAYSELGYEVNIGGNGVNSCEVSAMADAIIQKAYQNGLALNQEVTEKIERQIKELEEQFG